MLANRTIVLVPTATLTAATSSGQLLMQHVLYVDSPVLSTADSVTAGYAKLRSPCVAVSAALTVRCHCWLQSMPQLASPLRRHSATELLTAARRPGPAAATAAHHRTLARSDGTVAGGQCLETWHSSCSHTLAMLRLLLCSAGLQYNTQKKVQGCFKLPQLLLMPFQASA